MAPLRFPLVGWSLDRRGSTSLLSSVHRQVVLGCLVALLAACEDADETNTGGAGGTPADSDGSDATAPDAATPDPDRVDAGGADAAGADAAPIDAGALDAGGFDAGAADAATGDTSPVEDAARDVSGDAGSSDTRPRCGDGVVTSPAEACDDGSANSNLICGRCLSDCSGRVLGCFSACTLQDLRIVNEALVARADCGGRSRLFRIQSEDAADRIDASVLATQSLLLAALTHGLSVDLHYTVAPRRTYTLTQARILRRPPEAP